MTDTFHEDQYTALITARLILLKREIFQTKFEEKIKIFVLYSLTFFFENLTVYEIRFKNIVEPDRQQIAMWDTCIACWIPKDANIPLRIC
jgi:hypothetical protein